MNRYKRRLVPLPSAVVFWLAVRIQENPNLMQKPRWNPSMTPPSWVGPALLVALWWLSALACGYADYLAQPHLRGLYLSVPFCTWVVNGFMFVPILAAVVTIALSTYPGMVSLWHWNRQKPWLSVFWTLVMLGILTRLLPAIAFQGRFAQLSSAFGVYLILMFRAILVARCP